MPVRRTVDLPAQVAIAREHLRLAERACLPAIEGLQNAETQYAALTQETDLAELQSGARDLRDNLMRDAQFLPVAAHAQLAHSTLLRALAGTGRSPEAEAYAPTLAEIAIVRADAGNYETRIATAAGELGVASREQRLDLARKAVGTDRIPASNLALQTRADLQAIITQLDQAGLPQPSHQPRSIAKCFATASPTGLLTLAQHQLASAANDLDRTDPQELGFPARFVGRTWVPEAAVSSYLARGAVQHALLLEPDRARRDALEGLVKTVTRIDRQLEGLDERWQMLAQGLRDPSTTKRVAIPTDERLVAVVAGLDDAAERTQVVRDKLYASGKFIQTGQHGIGGRNAPVAARASQPESGPGVVHQQ